MTKSTTSNGENTAAGATQTFRLLKNEIARKLGKQSVGSISYRLLSDPERQHLYLTITGNDGGGYFSREIVPFSQVEKCLDKRLESDKPFPSKLFGDAFVGRSVNNAGFMAAILRHEQLLIPAPEIKTQHLIAGNWAAWQAAQRALPGELLDLSAPTSPPTCASATAEGIEAPSEKKTRTLTLKRPKQGGSAL